MHELSPSASTLPRVLVPEGYPAPFCFDLGQRTVQVVRRPLVRGARWVRALDAVTPATGRDCDLIHTLNAVPVLSRKPYVVTFESYLPRVPDDRYVPWLEAWLIRRLASPQCRRILAFSEFAMGQFQAQIARHPGSESLLAKAEVLYPVAPRRAEAPKRLAGAPIRLLFVGRDFMRKGGPALVRAHEELVRRGVPVETTVVSSLGWSKGDVAGPESVSVVESETKRLLGSGVRHVRTMRNPDVIQSMVDAHLLMLPSVNETFGFVCLEAMGCATPVVATRTYALPEIVGPDAGALLDLPVDALGKWVGLARRRDPEYDALYLSLMDDLGAQIADSVQALWERPDAYERASAAALQRMDTRFHPDLARDRLEGVYEQALGQETPPARQRVA